MAWILVLWLQIEDGFLGLSCHNEVINMHMYAQFSKLMPVFYCLSSYWWENDVMNNIVKVLGVHEPPASGSTTNFVFTNNKNSKKSNIAEKKKRKHKKIYDFLKLVQWYQGCALVEPGGPWRLTFALGQLENLRFFIQIICWAP